MRLFRKYDPLRTQNQYVIREGGRSLGFQSTEKVRGILYIKGEEVSIYINKESPMQYQEVDNLWYGEQKLKATVSDRKQGGHVDVKIPLQIIAKIDHEGTEETRTVYKFEKRPKEKFINGLKLFGSQVEFLEKLNDVEKARLENISIFEVRDTLLKVLAKTPRKWTNYLNAIQHIYHTISQDDFNKIETIKVPYGTRSFKLTGANIVLKVNGYNFFLTEGGVMPCGEIDVKSYLFDVPQAEIIENYIKEVLI